MTHPPETLRWEGRAPAKVNLFLRVLAREESGFHQIETLFQALELSDTIRVELVDRPGIHLDVDGAEEGSLGPMEKNLAVKGARAWLEAAGYRYTSQVKGRAGEKARQFFDRQHVFTRGRSVFHIDLHTGIMPPLSRYAPDFDTLWQRRHAVSMEDYEAQALAPGDMLLALCHQGIKDRWAWLKHVLDVAMAAQPVNGHWDEVLQRATDANSRRVLILGLYMAHEVLDAPLPPPVVATIASDWRVQRIGAWAVEKLPRRREEPDDSLRERIALHGLIQDSPLGSAQYAFYAALRKVWYYTEQVWPTPSF